MPYTIDPRQTDLIHLLHYQHAADFIGPRLPPNHPAYCAVISARSSTLRITVFPCTAKYHAALLRPTPTPLLH